MSQGGKGTSSTSGATIDPPHRLSLLAPRIYALAMMLRRTTNLASRRELGLSQESARIMILLGEYQPMMLGDFAQRSALDMGQLSRGVRELERQGLLSRTKVGRNVVHRLTAEGADVYRKLLAAAEYRNAFLLDGINEADKQALFVMLDAIMERATLLQEEEKERSGVMPAEVGTTAPK